MNTSKLALRGGWQRRPRRALASAAAIALGVSLASCSSGSHAGSTTTSTTTTSTTTTSTSPTSTTTTVPSSSLGSYLPLAPFAAYREVQAWQRSYLSGGHQPWHLDAGATALAFAAWLGFPQINKVVATRMDSTGAHVSIGFYVGGPSKETASSAVIHEVRWGNGSDAPWEVVGTDDKSFSLTAPAYGTTATSPVAVGGRISGVDENIAVEVRTSSSTSNIGTFCCRAAGGVNSPWSATVSFTAPSGSVLTIVARTGGHVATVEQFTVTGIRAG
jgi:hypothetical protein